jgi:hypothetical protein
MQGVSGEVDRIQSCQMGGSLQLVAGHKSQAFHYAQPWIPCGTLWFSAQPSQSNDVPRFGDLEPPPQEALCPISRDLGHMPGQVVPCFLEELGELQCPTHNLSWRPAPGLLPLPAAYQTLAHTLTNTHKPNPPEFILLLLLKSLWLCTKSHPVGKGWRLKLGSRMGGAFGRPWQPLGEVSMIKGGTGKVENY